MTKPKRELLRDDANGKIAGVCAGIADYFGWELWLVRIITVSAFFLGAGGLVLVLYIAAWVVLEKKSKAVVKASTTADLSPATEKAVEVKIRMWQRGEAPKQALQHLANQFDNLELRLRGMESHVTSAKFQLNREFNNL
ncbi:envelope stress response membrane protein PspC [Rheinheimera baltica]|uniref:Envelope stress response membrane protein PspC n=1 Tax=Rheinheimera baltica TaxID=67576 RepID=A0ABT9HTZ9_9GAMM|nr:envelope stress response membrane protein PspC [Rheinheimera baltica]MDP5134478.1 envelope stress response membrane protein PspC [Rheinheimera baltica]MDP5141303.1 envelope stress response membrane protein PspC [Rheinheimera baltica]MDP5148532.1 envelope stress response membrane protein PspC [Rheinheimera baltica]MDP5189172.1 envelope stress response membrane protein PspC [Rheinheimera baltica]